jgi:pimeloyl-ACP methyl ester carboxylesterase
MAYVQTRLGRWFYEEHGATAREGDSTIVLLHGLLFDGGMWRGQVGPLSALGRVVVFDAPGHGKSEVPPPFTLEEHARALVDAFDELRIATAVTVGLFRPARVAAMVLLGATADRPIWRERVEYRALCALALRIGLPPALARRKVVPLMFGRQTLAERPGLVVEFLRTLGGFPREGLVRATHAVSIDRVPILDSIRELKMPTLVGHGEDDTATPGDHSRRIASRIAGSSLAVFPGLGHMSALEGPEVVNRWVVPFVAEHVSPVPAR